MELVIGLPLVSFPIQLKFSIRLGFEFSIGQLYPVHSSILFILSNYSIADEKKKKDCLYCNEYERMEDWPASERPKEFIYEEINYPEGMFKSKIDRKTSKNRKSYAGKKEN